MPTLNLPDCDLFYQVDNFTDPWTQPETVLMLHGNAESSLAWYAWVPVLPGKSYHVAASDAQACAEATLAFMKQTAG